MRNAKDDVFLLACRAEADDGEHEFVQALLDVDEVIGWKEHEALALFVEEDLRRCEGYFETHDKGGCEEIHLRHVGRPSTGSTLDVPFRVLSNARSGTNPTITISKSTCTFSKAWSLKPSGLSPPRRILRLQPPVTKYWSSSVPKRSELCVGFLCKMIC